MRERFAVPVTEEDPILDPGADNAGDAGNADGETRDYLMTPGGDA